MFVSHPRQVLRSSSPPTPASFLRDSGSSCFSGSDAFSGWNIVLMTNRAAIFARSTQCLSSTVVVVIFLMKPSIDASLAVMYTSRGYVFAKLSSEWCLFSSRSRFLCGKLRYVVSCDSSLSSSFPRSIATLLIVSYSSGVGVVPKGNRRQRNFGLSTIYIQVNVVVAFE